MSQKNALLLVILSFFFIAISSHAVEPSNNSKQIISNFAPDNDLWMEDCLDCKTNGLDQVTFEKIIDVAVKIYKPLADNNNESLTVNKKWTDATVNANCLRSGGSVTVNMYGGLARRTEVTEEGFTLVLCHELSHAYGGTPYIQVPNRMSAEGQADYMSTFDCAKKVLKELKLPSYGSVPTSYMEKVCGSNEICLASLVGGQSLGNLLAVLSKKPIPDYETPDPLVTPKTLTSYPATVQCRLDTYHNGALGMPRPLCWFKP